MSTRTDTDEKARARVSANAEGEDWAIAGTFSASSRTFVELIFARADTTLRRVLHLMTTHGIHHVYVLDDDDRPVAVVTPTDVLRLLVVEDEDRRERGVVATSEAMMLRGEETQRGGREEIARRTRRVRDRTRDEAPTASSRERRDEAERREGTKKRATLHRERDKTLSRNNFFRVFPADRSAAHPPLLLGWSTTLRGDTHPRARRFRLAGVVGRLGAHALVHVDASHLRLRDAHGRCGGPGSSDGGAERVGRGGGVSPATTSRLRTPWKTSCRVPSGSGRWASPSASPDPRLPRAFPPATPGTPPTRAPNPARGRQDPPVDPRASPAPPPPPPTPLPAAPRSNSPAASRQPARTPPAPRRRWRGADRRHVRQTPGVVERLMDGEAASRDETPQSRGGDDGRRIPRRVRGAVPGEEVRVADVRRGAHQRADPRQRTRPSRVRDDGRWRRDGRSREIQNRLRRAESVHAKRPRDVLLRGTQARGGDVGHLPRRQPGGGGAEKRRGEGGADEGRVPRKTQTKTKPKTKPKTPSAPRDRPPRRRRRTGGG